MKVGFTCGCWNLLHPGHVWFLNECKKHCDYLVVAVANDEITKSKRVPVIKHDQRKYMLENLECVDFVASERKKTPPENIGYWLEMLNPDVFITNTDNPNLKVYKKLCKELKIKTKILKRNNEGMFNISTTEIIDKMKNDR